MTKTRRKKRISRMMKKRRLREEFLKEAEREGRKLGFKTAEEYILWKALREEGVEADHNVRVCGVEVDFYIKPNLIVEVGFLDNNLRKAWEMLEEKGYRVLYFANIEIRNGVLSRDTAKKIKKVLEEEA
ncbi:MAG: hypothetical protein ACE5IF_05870 [Candidatus Bathyarchaeia archaeon]